MERAACNKSKPFELLGRHAGKESTGRGKEEERTSLKVYTIYNRELEKQNGEGCDLKNFGCGWGKTTRRRVRTVFNWDSDFQIWTDSDFLVIS